MRCRAHDWLIIIHEPGQWDIQIVYRRAEQSHQTVSSIVEPEDGRSCSPTSWSSGQESNPSRIMRLGTKPEWSATLAREVMVASPVSMTCSANIRTSPTVVTNGITGSEHSFAALYLVARP